MIPSGTFRNLPSLVELDLSANKIGSIHKNDIPENVEIINLSNNKIPRIDVDVFENLPRLKTVNVRLNKLRTIPEDTFKQNVMIEEVLLGGNQIGTLSPKTFDGLKNLNYVDLDENVCLSGNYGAKSLKALKSDIKRLCAAAEDRRQIGQATPATTVTEIMICFFNSPIFNINF
jgi:Leucine-rich repeat (LRR) protein